MARARSLLPIAIAISITTALATFVACVTEDPGPSGSNNDAGGGSAIDAGPDPAEDGGDADSSSPKTDPCSGAFGAPTEVPGLHVAGAKEISARFSADGLSVVLARAQTSTGLFAKLYLADRPTVSAAFPFGTIFPELDAGNEPNRPTFAKSTDKLSVYFDVRTPGATLDIYQSTRPANSGVAFATPILESAISGATDDESQPFVTGDRIYFTQLGPSTNGSSQVRFAQRSGAVFGAKTTLKNLDGYAFPVVTNDHKTIFIAKEGHLFSSGRATADADFDPPTKLPPEVSTGNEEPTDVSSDACTLYFSRGSGAERKIMQTKRAP